MTEPTARERFADLLNDYSKSCYGQVDDVLDNLPLVLEAAREAGKAEEVEWVASLFPDPPDGWVAPWRLLSDEKDEG